MPPLEPVAEAAPGGGSAAQSRASGSAMHVEQQRDVGDGARHRPAVRDGPERARRPRRDAAEGRLDARQAAEAARDPDRAAAVGAQRQRDHAGRQRGRAPAARAAGRALEVPRVARDALQRAVGDALPAELGRRRLAERARRRGGGARRRRARRRPTAPAGSIAREPRSVGQPRVRKTSLTADGHAVERAGRLAAAPALLRGARRRPARARASTRQKALSARVVALDPLQRGPRRPRPATARPAR